MMLLRYTSAAVLGTVATFGLLVLMRSVIADPMPAEDAGIEGEVLDFVRLEKERVIIADPPKPEPPPPVDEPPPPLPPVVIDGTPIGRWWEPPEPTREIGGILDNRYLADGEYLPIVRVSPIYPRRALTRGIEGYVLVEFVVTETGAVSDPVVLFADPPGFFEHAALTAVLKFKYRPKVTGGKPVAVSGVRSRIVFEMED